MTLLVASLLALFVGPVFVHVMGRRHAAILAIDGFVLVAIGGLVLFHILPHSVADAGWPALIAAAIGLVVPTFFHPPLEECPGREAMPLLSLAILTIALHAFLDGVGLVDPSASGDGNALGIAVVLHRILEGLGIWWLVRPHYGRRGTIAVVGVMAVATIMGFFSAGAASHAASERVIDIVQVAVAGSLLHVLMRHAPVRATDSSGGNLASALGGLTGMALLITLERLHTHGGAPPDSFAAWNTLFLLAAHAAPALLAAYCMVAIFHAIAPAAAATLLLPGSRLRQAWRGSSVGMAVAVCSCGVLPLYRNLLAQRTPPAAAMAYLVAAPAVGFASILLSLVFLGGELTLTRVASSLLVAWGIGAWVASPQPTPLTKHEPTVPSHGRPHSLGQRLADGTHYAFGEVLDHSAPWVLLGLVSAASVAAMVPDTWLRHVPPGVDVLLLALLAAPLYWSASATTLIAAVLWHKGVSVGAVMAFVLCGSAISVTTALFVARTHGRGVAWRLTGAVVLGACALGYAANAWLPPVEPYELMAQPPALWMQACLLVLMALFVVSLLRQGVRLFIEQLATPNALGKHGHHHHHDPQNHHGHDEHHDPHDSPPQPARPL